MPWDNVKHVGEQLKPRGQPRKAYETDLWGVKVRIIERGYGHAGRGLPFGIVVTLREMNGVNRIDDFVQRCSLRGWIASTVDIQNRVNIYNASEIEIGFEE